MKPFVVFWGEKGGWGGGFTGGGGGGGGVATMQRTRLNDYNMALKCDLDGPRYLPPSSSTYKNLARFAENRVI